MLLGNRAIYVDFVLWQLPECPWCKTPIRYNKRYNNIIHAIREEVEKVKVKIKGQKDEIESARSRLKNKIDEARLNSEIISYRSVPLFQSSERRTSLRRSSSRIRSKFPSRSEVLNKWSTFFKNLTDMLRKGHYKLSLADLAGIEILLDMYYNLRDIDTLDTKCVKGIKLKDFKQFGQFRECFDFLREKTKDFFDIPTNQEITDWQNEYKRCKYILSLLEIFAALKASKIKLDEHEKEKK